MEKIDLAGTRIGGLHQMDDEELVKRARGGDRPALGVLVSRYERRMYNAALKITGNRQDAEDALQETFLTLVRRLGSFRGDARFSTWLYRVAVNAGLQVLRRRTELPSLDGGERAPAEPSHDRTPLKSVLVNETKELLNNAVAELPEALRTVFVLRELQGLSTAAVAEVLEISDQAVKNRLHRARLALREKIAPYFDNEERGIRS